MGERERETLCWWYCFDHVNQCFGSVRFYVVYIYREKHWAGDDDPFVFVVHNAIQTGNSRDQLSHFDNRCSHMRMWILHSCAQCCKQTWNDRMKTNKRWIHICPNKLRMLEAIGRFDDGCSLLIFASWPWWNPNISNRQCFSNASHNCEWNISCV